MPVTFTEEDFAAPAAPAAESPHEFSEDDFKESGAPTLEAPPGILPDTPQTLAEARGRSSGVADVARGLGFMGKSLVAGLGDVGEIAFRPVTAQMYPEQAEGYIPPPENIQALMAGEELPAKNLASLPRPAQFAGHAAQGLIETAPKMAAVTGLQAAGVPAPIGAGLVFGTTEQGFDPVQGAIAAALPLAGKVSGGVAGTVAKVLGVDSTAAINWIKGIAGTAGPAAAMVAQGEAEIRKLPPEQQEAARVSMWEGVAGQAALGPMGVNFEKPLLPRTSLAAGLAKSRAARAAQEGAKTPAEAQTPQGEPAAAATTPPNALHPEVETLLKATQESTDMPDVEFVSESDLKDNEPFWNRRIATVNRETGKIVLNPENLNGFLMDDVPPERRAQALQTILTHENLHLRTSAEDASNYLGTLTSAEKFLERKLYGDPNVSDQNLGFEAVRRRIERLSGMDTSEAVAAIKGERLRIKSLEALNDTIRGIREKLGTKASKEGLAILDRVQKNLNAGIVALGGTVKGPAAMRPAGEEDKLSLTPELKVGDKYIEGRTHSDIAKAEESKWKRGEITAEQYMDTLEAFGKEDTHVFRDQYGVRHDRGAAGGLLDEAMGNPKGTTKALHSQGIPAEYHGLAPVAEPAALRPIKIQIEKPDGSRVEGEWKGYFEGFPGNPAMVGRLVNGEMSHGILKPGEKIIGEVPTLEQWKQQQAEPAALRRKPKSGQEAFYLPPAAKGKAERNMPAADSPPLKVFPVELDWEQGGKQGAYRPISDAEARNPKELNRLLTADARIAGSNLPVSNTRRMVVMIDRNNGQVHVVSAYPSARYGAMVVDPSKSGASARPNVPIENLLSRYKPLVSLLRTSPVKNFHQAFDGFADYETRFGEEARNRSHESLGKIAAAGVQRSYEPPNRELSEETPPQAPEAAPAEASPEGEVVGPEGGEAESVLAGEEPGQRSQSEIPTDADLRAFHDFFEGEPPKTKGDFDFKMGKAAASASRQMANAVYIAAQHEAALNPTMEPEAAVESALSKLYEELANSGTRKEFIEKASARYRQGVAQTLQERRLGVAQPEAAPTGRELTLPRFSRKGAPAPPGEGPVAKLPAPTPPVMLSPEDAARIRAEAAKKYPPRFPETLYKQIGEAQVPKEPYNVGKTEAAKFEEAAPEPKPEEFELESDLARGIFEGKPEEPGALRPLRDLKRNLEDQAKEAGAAFTTMVERHDVATDVARGIESVDNTTNNLANQADFDVRLRSIEKPKGRLAQNLTAWARGNKEILSAANVLIEARFDKGQLSKFQGFLNQARSIGEADAQSPSWITRAQGKARLREVEKLQASLNFAAHNWTDPNLQATAKRAATNYQEIFDHEKASGYDVTKDPNYLPHRYVGGTRVGQRTFVKGKRFREPKAFDSLYEAIANPDDLYISATHDAASLVGHRARQSLNMINKDRWIESLKAMDLPNGDKLALAPKMGAHGLVSPDSNYRLVSVAPGKILAIHNDFADGIQNLTAPDWVENWGPSRALLHATQMLKHTLLIGDFFHLMRMGYYGTAIMGRKFGWKGGWTVLDIASKNIPEAVKRGIITQEAADWGREQIPFGNTTISRRGLVEKFYKQYGSNMGKIQDALYKDLITEGSSASPLAQRALSRVSDPTVGRYNRFLFDKLTRGLMAESVAREFERQSKANPGLSPDALMKDISRDVNNFYGNIGRQGWFKSAGMRSFMRLFALAPQWVEGLAKKEAIAYSRLSGISKLAGKREGVTALGTTGTAIGKAMLTMAVVTQAINIITRGKPTWKNEEKEHKFDAWVPVPGAKEGMWFSPLAIFNELTHDFYRLSMSKSNFREAAAQIAGNKEAPLLRAAIVMGTGYTPTGEKTTTTGEAVRSAAGALAPVPITFGKYGQALGHAVAPGTFPAVPRQALYRQAASTAGIKMEPALTQTQEMRRMAQDFIKKAGLQKDSGWVQVQTTDPSYSKLRQALRIGDEAKAKRLLDGMRKTHTDHDILKAMKQEAKQGFTGSQKNERKFIGSLDDKQLDQYTEALDAKLSGYEKFVDWYLTLPDASK